MNSLLRFVVISLAYFSLGFPGSSAAVDLGSFGDRIFQFQEKLAKNGNKLAQYKLGTLYEFGISVEPNEASARHWYKMSASQDYEPAVNRLIFLEVRQQGFDEDKHGEWLERVMKRVDENEADAMILLGQMTRYGIVVDKNLNLAVGLLQRASSLGHTEVDSQIDELKREILDDKARNERQARKQKVVKKEKTSPAPKKTRHTAGKNDARKQAEEEARRQRYEEAMRQFYKETLLIQQQQEWAESVAPVE